MKRELLFLALLAGMLPAGARQDNGNHGEVADTLRYMNDDPFNLDQVVVTGTRTQKKLKDVPVITQVVTAKQIEERGISDIKDLLAQEVPGLNFQEVGFGTDIDIQGLGAKHVLFLIDGERIAGENSGNIDYQRINLFNVDRIEIVKGASSALYGSQAMGGVINIITKKAKKKVEATAGVKYTGRNQKNYGSVDKSDSQYKFKKHLDKPNIAANASVGLNLGKFTMNTDFLYKSADAYQLYDKKAQVKYFPKYDYTVTEELSSTPTTISGYEDFQVSTKMGYKFSDKLNVKVHGGFYTMNKYDFTADNVFDNTEDFSYGASAQYKFTPHSVLDVSLHGDHYNRYDKFEKKSGRRLEYRNNIIQPRVTYTNTAIENMTITAGAEYFSESLYGDKFDTEVYGEGEYETRSQYYWTVFAQDDWAISKQFSVVAGVRGDFHKEYGTNITPKLSLMYKAFPFTVRLNYARGYRSPTLKELYMNWDHLGMFHIYGNKDLKPESNNYISLSGEYVNRWINVNVNVYSNWFRNKIEGMWANDGKEYHYVNIGKSHLAGLEAMAKVKFCRYLQAYGTYNYLYTSKNDGVKLSSSSPHSGTIQLEFNSRVPRYATVVNLTGTIMGKKEYDVSDEITVNGETVEAYYKAKVPTYSIWDFTVTQYVMQDLRFTAGVSNLFDFTADIVSFNSSTSVGRNFFVAMSYTL